MPNTNGTLWLVPTPIGNPDDMSARAVRVLKDTDVIAAENTGRTRSLLERYGIKNRVVAYNEQNEDTRIVELLSHLTAGRDVAIIADAGTPAVSSPGGRIEAAAIARGLTVRALPGPSAIMVALTVSGLPTESFVFLGTIPLSGAVRGVFVDKVVASPHTVIFFEAPRNLVMTLMVLGAKLGKRRVAVCLDLTKEGEEVLRGTANDLAAQLSKRTTIPEELTVLVEGASAGDARSISLGG